VLQRLIYVWLLPCGALLAQQAQGYVTNQRVTELLSAGVRTEEIFRIISTAPQVSFNLSPRETDALMKAGVPEEMIKAMSAREQGIPFTSAVSARVYGETLSDNQNRILQPPVPSPATALVVPAPMPVATSVRGPAPSVTVPPPPTPTPVPALPGVAGAVDLLTDAEVNHAIEQGLRGRRQIGLTLNDIQTSFLTAVLCTTCAESGYTIHVYTPEKWIQQMAVNAKREMLPFSGQDVIPEVRQKMFHVVAMPSTPEYLSGNGFSLSSSVHRIVLTDMRRTVVIQPVELSNGSVTSNSAFRSANFTTAHAGFMMNDVNQLRASAVFA
jgi:hypothetical protein